MAWPRFTAWSGLGAVKLAHPAKPRLAKISPTVTHNRVLGPCPSLSRYCPNLAEDEEMMSLLAQVQKPAHRLSLGPIGDQDIPRLLAKLAVARVDK